MLNVLFAYIDVFVFALSRSKLRQKGNKKRVKVEHYSNLQVLRRNL